MSQLMLGEEAMSLIVSLAPSDGGTVASVANGGTYTALATDSLIVCTDTSTAITVNMPASPVTGQSISVKKNSTSQLSITVSGNGSNIENPGNPGNWASSVSLSPGPSGAVCGTWTYTGTQWDLVSLL